MITAAATSSPGTTVTAAAIAAGATTLAALVAWLTAALQRRADRLRREAEDHRALRSAVTEAVPHISATYQNVRDALLEPLPPVERAATLARVVKDLDVVRGDGARIVAVDADGLASDLFVAQDAAYLAVKDMVWFLRRAMELGLDEDPTYESQAAIVAEDANTALRHYLKVVNERIAPKPPGNKLVTLGRQVARLAARHPALLLVCLSITGLGTFYVSHGA